MHTESAAVRNADTNPPAAIAARRVAVLNSLNTKQWQSAIAELQSDIRVAYQHAYPIERKLVYEVMKRLFDVVATSVALIMLSPVLLGIMIAIKRDSKGSVFFWQQRVGRNFKVFSILKFRTMYEDAADVPVQIYDIQAKKYRRPTSQEDPRVTKVGKFLRTWSLDELPQLFNVLRGDMTLIGPRPLSLAESFTIPEAAFARYQVPLGLSGLAQLRNRNAALDSNRFDDDLEYLKQRSFWFDLKLVIWTLTKLKQN